MTPSRDYIGRACRGALPLAMLGLAVGLALLLFGRPGTSSVTPVYAQSPLLPAALVAPPDGAVISDTTPTLSWTASPPPATGYHLKVDGWVKDVGSATSGEPSPLGDGAHTWTVSAYDGLGGESDNAPARSFTVDTTPPPPPVLQSPASRTATGNTSVTLEWAASAGAPGYRLNWDGTIGDVGNATWQVLSSLAGDSYSWSVAAYDSVGNVSAYPPAWTVRVDTTTPPVPDLLAPGDRSILNTSTPLLNWTAVVDAVGYMLKWDGTVVDVGT